MSHYIGIDPGERAGIAIYSSEDACVVAASPLRDKGQLGIDAYVWMLQHRVGDVRGILVEGQFVGRSKRGALTLGRRAGEMMMAAGLAYGGVTIHRHCASEWRKLLGWPPLKSDAAKTLAVDYARDSLFWEADTVDEAEACCMAQACALATLEAA